MICQSNPPRHFVIMLLWYVSKDAHAVSNFHESPDGLYWLLSVAKSTSPEAASDGVVCMKSRQDELLWVWLLCTYRICRWYIQPSMSCGSTLLSTSRLRSLVLLHPILGGLPVVLVLTKHILRVSIIECRNCEECAPCLGWIGLKTVTLVFRLLHCYSMYPISTHTTCRIRILRK